MLLLTAANIREIVQRISLNTFIEQLVSTLESDYRNWSDFDKTARIAHHVPDGVIELMPIANHQYYSFKYVNGHPKNPLIGESTVMATGQLSLLQSGRPLLFSEMTLLTALRTAATSALAAKYLADKNSQVLCLIGTGAQSEFQCLAFMQYFNLKEVRYFDIDPQAMLKFASNLKQHNITLTPCINTSQAVVGADIITTCTADKNYQTILSPSMLDKPVYINALGGDCPGKTELAKSLVENSQVVVEYLPQSKIEGEIQQLHEDFICPELEQIINQKVTLNVAQDGTIIYDSVGFALEDFSVLRLVYQLAQQHNIGKEVAVLSPQDNVKDLYALLKLEP